MANADHDILCAALESAWEAYQKQSPRPTILSGPAVSILDNLCKAIGECSAFKDVAGKIIYSGGSAPVIDSHLFASHLFGKIEHSEGKGIPEAANWLLQLLATRTTTGLFKVAIWGASIDREFALRDGSRIMPFDALLDTFMKGRILERAKPCYDKSAWLAHNYFDAPQLAFVKQISNFPYIHDDITAFRTITELQLEARDFWLFVEAACVGHPLAIGCWFEYADQDFDINAWDNSLAWVLPEIPPRVPGITTLKADAVQSDIQRYEVLPEELRLRLLRSMERFTLSQCRHRYIDRILDLDLAFEIAVSGPARDAAPMGWKVSVRSAQLIGGTLAVRQANRDLVNSLFRLRSKATHGSDLNRHDENELEETVRNGLATYRELISSFLELGQMPDWNVLELEPRSTNEGR